MLKLSDMGFARFIENGFLYDPSCSCSLYAYALPLSVYCRAAPDFLLTCKRTLSTDIYSLGMVFLELVKGGFAYAQQDLEDCMVNNVMDTNKVSDNPCLLMSSLLKMLFMGSDLPFLVKCLIVGLGQRSNE